MARSSSQSFLKELDKKLWTADRLRANLDATVYKRAALDMNPPFNIGEWWDARLEVDPRWKYDTPTKDNANFAWSQHMLHHVAPKDSTTPILANGSRRSISGGEGETHQAIINAVLVVPTT